MKKSTLWGIMSFSWNLMMCRMKSISQNFVPDQLLPNMSHVASAIATRVDVDSLVNAPISMLTSRELKTARVVRLPCPVMIEDDVNVVNVNAGHKR